MEIRPLTPSFDLTLDAAHRAPGLHVSDVLREAGRILGEFEDGEFTDMLRLPPLSQSFQVPLLRCGLGRAWEDYYAPMLAALYPAWGLTYHPGELSADGITGTPDGYSLSGAGLAGTFPAIHEFKLTWRSTREFRLEREWYYVSQCRAYCYLAGVEHARLWIYHVNGGYAGYLPSLTAWELHFTKEELENTWKLILHEARRMEAVARSS